MWRMAGLLFVLDGRVDAWIGGSRDGEARSRGDHIRT